MPIDFFQNSLCLKKLGIFARISGKILRAYAYIWSKNFGKKASKRTILTNKWNFERSLIEKRVQDHSHRLKIMGGTFIGLALLFSVLTYLLPMNENNYWLSSHGKQGFYVLSAGLFFLGCYCLGATYRRSIVD